MSILVFIFSKAETQSMESGSHIISCFQFHFFQITDVARVNHISEHLSIVENVFIVGVIIFMALTPLIAVSKLVVSSAIYSVINAASAAATYASSIIYIVITVVLSLFLH